MNVGSVGSNFTYVFARARRVSPAFVPSRAVHRRAVGTFVGAESEELAYAPTKKVRARDERDDGARDGAMGGRRRCARVDGRRAKGRTRD
jgi:hypothetical protein